MKLGVLFSDLNVVRRECLQYLEHLFAPHTLGCISHSQDTQVNYVQNWDLWQLLTVAEVLTTDTTYSDSIFALLGTIFVHDFQNNKWVSIVMDGFSIRTEYSIFIRIFVRSCPDLRDFHCVSRLFKFERTTPPSCVHLGLDISTFRLGPQPGIELIQWKVNKLITLGAKPSLAIFKQLIHNNRQFQPAANPANNKVIFTSNLVYATFQKNGQTRFLRGFG